jgi:glycosyltransferase involved in cell wall biosynthesis
MGASAALIGTNRSVAAMHILFINPCLTRYDSEASIWARRLIADLRATEATVTTLTIYSDQAVAASVGTGTLGGRMRRAVLRFVPQVLTGWLIELKLFCRALYSMIWCSWMVRRKRKSLQPDIVYARTFEYDWTPWLVSSALKCPMVLEVHSPFYLERRFRGLRESKLIRVLDRALWRRAAMIRVVSKPVAKLLAAETVEARRVRFIPYGIDVEAMPDRLTRSAGEALRIVFVGSFYPWHGAEVLVTALALAQSQVPNLRLSLIGDGLARQACVRRARELGLDETVEFTGWLPWEEVAQRLKAADLAVAPFLKIEPFYFDPVKVMEYMAFGLPIIASDLERIAEMLHFGEAGMLVKPGDAGALAEALIALAGDPRQRERLGKAARDIIEHDFSRRVVAEEVLALCRAAATSA